MEVRTERNLVVLCCGDPVQQLRGFDKTVKAIKNLANGSDPALATIDGTSNPRAIADRLQRPLKASDITHLVATRVRSVDDLVKRLQPCFTDKATTLVIVGEDERIADLMKLAGAGGHRASFEQPRHLRLISRKCPLKKRAKHQLRLVK